MALRRVGLFGGTFDPIHLGHVNLCIAMKEALFLDEVLVCPCGRPVFKDPSQVIASAAQRLEMAKKAFQDVPYIRVIDNEVQRQTSFTIDTLKELKNTLGDIEIFLMMGSDAADRFFSWKDPEEILGLAKLAIALRTAEMAHPLIGVPIVIPIFEISSTTVRKRLEEKKFCGHLVPAKVLDTIAKNGLYSFE